MIMSRRARNDTKNSNNRKMLKTGAKVGSCAIPIVGTVVIAKTVIPKVTKIVKEKIGK
jgi:hypothetical protein